MSVTLAGAAGDEALSLLDTRRRSGSNPAHG